MSLNELIPQAHSLGAADAAFIPPEAIVTREDLAQLCAASPCENHGLSPSCPPHVSGPEGFRQLQARAAHALVFRLTVPAAILFSLADRREVMALLHQTAAALERTAKEKGYSDAQAFAGGSCKTIFCTDHVQCRVLAENKACRHPHRARPSMSGFGIDVGQLMATCGWPAELTPSDSDGGSMSWVAGLVLLIE